MVNKLVVRYNRDKFKSISVGHAALVYPIDHPSPLVSNEDLVTTSTVIRYNEDTGSFETKNTIYNPYSPCRLDDMKLLPMSTTEKENC